MQVEPPKVTPDWEEDIPLIEDDSQIEVDAIGTVAPDDAYQVRTRHSFATHPVSKGVIVLGISFMLMSLLGVFLKAMTGGFSGSGSSATTTPEPIATTSAQNSITEADTLKAKLMLNEQNKDIKAFRNGKQDQQQEQQPKPVSPQPVSPPVTVQAPPVASTPRQVYSRRPNYYPPQTSRPIASVPASIPSRPVSSKLSQKEKDIDPMAKWLAAANIGNYGSSSPKASPSTEDVDDGTTSTKTDNSGWEASGGIGTPPQQVSNAINYQSNASVSQVKQVGNERNTNNQVSLIFGTRSAAKLDTPIAWSGNLNNPTQNFLIQLNEPLKAANNTVAIPKGTYLRAKVSAASETGLLQMSVVSILMNSNGQTIERSIPEGALLIFGKGGRPLKASAQRSDTTSNELGMVVLSGISSATSLINQPTSQSIFSDGNGYQSTITNSNRNYLAGFGQGASQALVQQMQRRNQQALQSRQSEPNVFVLNQGTSVQVYVNQSVSF
jgi:hypothetical protein